MLKGNIYFLFQLVNLSKLRGYDDYNFKHGIQIRRYLKINLIHSNNAISDHLTTISTYRALVLIGSYYMACVSANRR